MLEVEFCEMHKACSEHWPFPPLQEVVHVFMRNWGHTVWDVVILRHEYTWPEVFSPAAALIVNEHALNSTGWTPQIWLRSEDPWEGAPRGHLLEVSPALSCRRGTRVPAGWMMRPTWTPWTPGRLEDRRELSPSSISAELSLLWATWVHCNKTAVSRSKVRIGLPPQEENVIGGKHE